MGNNDELALARNEYKLIFLLTSAIVTTFLFYIDEGNNNFNWITNWGAWMIFMIYVLPLYFVQWLLFTFLLKRLKKPIGVILSISFGLIFGLMFGIVVTFG